MIEVLLGFSSIEVVENLNRPGDTRSQLLFDASGIVTNMLRIWTTASFTMAIDMCSIEVQRQSTVHTIMDAASYISWCPEILFSQLSYELLFEDSSLLAARWSPAIADSPLKLPGFVIALIDTLLSCLHGSSLDFRSVLVG